MANDELGYQVAKLLAELLQFLLARGFDFISSVCIQPRTMALSKYFRKSFFDPKKLGFVK